MSINLTSLGIINGCVDLLVQETSAPEFAYNRNPYGIAGITKEEFSNTLIAFHEKGGCKDRILECLHLGKTLDPEMYGDVDEVNHACKNASDFCQKEVEGPYIFRKKRGFYDITHCYLDAVPPNQFMYYLADEKVRDALGVPVNITELSNTVSAAFNSTGDYPRRDPRGYLEDIALLLDSGIQVTMVYGDRDFACNWIGGERVSLGVSYSHSDDFRRAGYANVTIDNNPPVGQVRQHGRFSFTRVYESGHMVPAYQPKAAYHILHRAMQGKDIATGSEDTNDDYSTDGFWISNATFTAPSSPAITCDLRGMASTCAENQIEDIREGRAEIVDGIITHPTPYPDPCPKIPPDGTEVIKNMNSWDTGNEL